MDSINSELNNNLRMLFQEVEALTFKYDLDSSSFWKILKNAFNEDLNEASTNFLKISVKAYDISKKLNDFVDEKLPEQQRLIKNATRDCVRALALAAGSLHDYLLVRNYKLKGLNYSVAEFNESFKQFQADHKNYVETKSNADGIFKNIKNQA